MLLTSYCHFIVQHPFVLLLSIFSISSILTLIPFLCHEPPSFADPTAGFETRGTHLANRFKAWENLLDETRPSKRLAANPKDIADQIRFNRTLHNKTVKVRPRSGLKTKQNKKTRQRNKTSNNTTYGDLIFKENITPSSSEHVHWAYGHNASVDVENAALLENYTITQWEILKEMQKIPNIPMRLNNPLEKCGSPINSYAHIVIIDSNGTSMLAYQNIQSLCNLQSRLEQVGTDEYHESCERTTGNEDLCCPVWSVPNYIALIAGKYSCHNLTEEDIKIAINILQHCAAYFHNFTLLSSCDMDKCDVPKYCSQYNAIYNILYYLIDSEAFSPQNYEHSFVKQTMIFLPLARSSTVMPYYKKLQVSNMSIDSLVIQAMDFGLKNALFDLWILQDTWLVLLGGIFVFLGVWVYTKSALLTLLLLAAVSFSLGIAYFIYIYVLKLEFFPFMNLLVIVVVVGIGADDAFLYVKIWNTSCKKLIIDSDTNQDCVMSAVKTLSCAQSTILVQILEDTLKHSAATILITSLTTAVAFLASYVSYIPAINCFSVFAGTTVLVNFFLMVTWLPITVFIIDVKLGSIKLKKFEKLWYACLEMWFDLTEICNRFIITTVSKLYWVFVIVFGSVGIISLVVVFYKPGLILPDSRDFQLFQSIHPFEQYDMYYRDKFLFEKFGGEAGSKMPLRWVWGVKAIDNGDHMNPSSNGHLVLDDEFSISDQNSQIWLFEFCTKVKTQSFYQHVSSPFLPNCFMENFRIYMDRKCIDKIERIDRTPCCNASQFPYKKQVFDFCIVKAMESLYQTPRKLFIPGVAGPKFLKTSSPLKIAAIVVEFESTVSYSMSYTQMAQFYNDVENWTQNILKSAPYSMQGGWFISDFQFYDLQYTLASSTSIALALSAVLGFIVLIPATRNVITSLCALCAMIFSATVTIGILVLNGWKLNVLESVAISTSAGLAVDFSLHYALSFTHANGPKSFRAKTALASSAGPTSAAALTTGFAGIFLLRSKLLPYSQIGTFLVLIMSVSWIYATFFLCSLFFLVGQNSGPKKVKVPKQKPVSRVTSICSVVPEAESHELEHLGDSNATKTTNSHSPSGISATTIVLHEDCYDVARKMIDKRHIIVQRHDHDTT